MTMTKKSIAAVAASVAVAAGIAGGIGAGDAQARTYTTHSIKLTKSQTVLVANNHLGDLFAGVPYIPNLIYNPSFGHGIQEHAEFSKRRGGCIEVGIATPRGGGASNVNYVTSYPARYCAA